MLQDISSLLKNLLSEDTIQGISTSAGTDIPQTKTAVKTALPELIKGLSKNCESKDGAESLSTALDDHKGSVLDDIVGAIGNSNTKTDGAKIVEHVFSDKGSTVINNIAAKAGISSSQATGILHTVAPFVMEALGKTKQEQDLKASDITGVLSGILTNLLDKNKDGNFKDDLLTMLINWIKKLLLGK